MPELRHHCPDVPFILVGNKADLRSDERALEKLKAKGASLVSFEHAQRVGQDVGADAVLECSAKTQEGVKDVFDNAVRAAFRGFEKRGFLKPGDSYRPYYYRKSCLGCSRCREKSRKLCRCASFFAKVRGGHDDLIVRSESTWWP